MLPQTKSRNLHIKIQAQGNIVMKKKFQIFISSTYKDLIEERLIVKKAILEMEHIPTGHITYYKYLN